MLDWTEFERSGLIFQVYLTPYGHAEITFARKLPFVSYFTVTLSKEDLKKMLKLLNKLAKKWEVK